MHGSSRKCFKLHPSVNVLRHRQANIREAVSYVFKRVACCASKEEAEKVYRVPITRCVSRKERVMLAMLVTIRE